MTYTTFRNPCVDPAANIVVFESFLQAHNFAREHPELIELEIEADSIAEARQRIYWDHRDTRDEYLATLQGDIY
jgi:hypothetical protein